MQKEVQLRSCHPTGEPGPRYVKNYHWRTAKNMSGWLKVGTQSLSHRWFKKSECSFFGQISRTSDCYSRLASRKFVHEATAFTQFVKRQMGVEIFMLAGWPDENEMIKKIK